MAPEPAARTDRVRSVVRSLLLGGGAALGVLVAGAGCLIPLPLEQATQPDAGEMLVIKGAQPKPFGTFTITSEGDNFLTLSVDVATQSPAVGGLLYRQINGTCCELDPINTEFGGQGITAPTSDPGRWTISFPVQPCLRGLKTAYLVPVIASGGIVSISGNDYIAKGEVERTHYWTVLCP